MTPLTRLLRSPILPALAVLASGCGVVGGATVLAVSSSSGGGSGGGARPNTAPAIAVDDAAFPQSVTGNLVLAFTITDDENDTVTVATEVSDDNGATFRAIPASAIVSGSNQGLGGSPDGVRFSFTINLSDPSLFPGQTVPQAVLRVRATDSGGLVSADDLTAAFRIENNTAPVVVVQNNQSDSQEVALVFTVSDAEAVPGPGVTGATLTDGSAGTFPIAGFFSLTQQLPIQPGTLLIRLGQGRVLRDLDQGDGTGRIVALNGPEPLGPGARIRYASGAFEGDATVSLTQAGPITADYNRSFLIVTDVAYDDLRNAEGFLPCAAASPNQLVPFPTFVDQGATQATFVWDSLSDLGFGNAQFVQLRVTVSDGQTTTSAAGNNFLINNGPLGELTQLPADGQADAIEVGDIDGDGFVDALILNSASPTASVSVFYGSNRGFAPVQVLPFPAPMAGGQPLLASPASGTRPAGGLDPSRFTLIDVNRDGRLDIVVSSESTSPTSPAQDYYRGVLVYFGTGQRSAPFDIANVWGPIPSGGWGITRMRTLQTNDDSGDGIVDDQDVADLVLTTRFSHDPRVTRSRAPLTGNAPIMEALADQPMGQAGMAYTLAGQALTSAPLRPGSLQLAWNGGANVAVDQAVLGDILGLVVDVTNPAAPQPFAYVVYANGLFVGDPRAIGLPAPAGALPGTTPFGASGAVLAAGQQVLPLTPASDLNAGAHMEAPLQTGDGIRIRGFGWAGLRVITEAAPGIPITDGTGAPVAIVNKTEPFLPIDATFAYGSEVTTVQDLLDRLATLVSGQRANPANEAVTVSLEASGRIRIALSKRTPGPDSLQNPDVTFITTCWVAISDARGNSWPAFEDPHGRVTVYQVRDVPNLGGFSAPNLSQTLEFPAGNSFFPPTLPAAPLPLIPESPDPLTGRATAPGPGTVDDILGIIAALGGAVPFPLQFSTAAGATPNVASPLSPPDHLEVIDATTGAAYTGGFVPRDVTAGAVFPFSPLVGANDPFPDLLVPCGGDASITVLPKVPRDVLLAADPSNTDLQLFFALYDYADGLYASQELDAAALVNTDLLRRIGPSAAGFFLVPDGNAIPNLRFADVDGDARLDVVGAAGNFLLYARNLLDDPPPAPLPPFEVQLAVPGLTPGRPGIGDINSDGLADIVVPIGATKEVAALIQVPRGRQVLSAGGVSGLQLEATLTDLELGRATLIASSLRGELSSGGIPHLIRVGAPQTTTRFTLELVRDAGSPSEFIVDADVGSVDIATGLLSLTIDAGFAIDAQANSEGLVLSFDQLFTRNFTTNANLRNFRSVLFPSGFIPAETAVVDVDNDGLSDIVTLDALTNNLSFRLQIRELRLDSFFNVATGLTPIRMDAGDLIQGDGLAEVVVSNGGSNTVSVFRADASLGLTLVQEVPVSVGANLPTPLVPFGLQVVDLDQAGGPPALVVAVSGMGGAGAFSFVGQQDTFGGGFVIIPGLSQAQFAAGQRLQATQLGLGLGNSIEVEATDVNGDGFVDIALSNNGGGVNPDGSISFYLNRGVGPGGRSFFGNAPNPLNPNETLPVALPIAGSPSAPGRVFISRTFNAVELNSADLNGDGFSELVFGLGSGKVNGFGGFGVMQGRDPSDLSDPVSGGERYEVDPLAVNPGAFLTRSIDISQITSSASVATVPADLNGDGRPDLVISDLTADARAGYVINRSMPGEDITTSSFLVFSLPAAGQPGGLDVADLNGDGALDIILSIQTEPFILVYLSRFDPNDPQRFSPENGSNELGALFSPPIFLSSDLGVIDVLAIDLNGDGRLDLLGASTITNTLNVYLQR